MEIKEDIIKKSYEKYIKNKNDNWEFANDVLYDLCSNHPLHKDPHKIVAKVWLIGRSYAAAIERTKSKKSKGESSEDFYYEKVAPIVLDHREKLDEYIKILSCKKSISKNIELILKTHRELVDAFKEISELPKRSLASKYLHFHCKDLFFLYDSRACSAVSRIIQRPDNGFLKQMKDDDYDNDYAIFVNRMMILKDYLKTVFKKDLSPRELDKYLLSGEIEKAIKSCGR